jgi:hypothetical protein
MATAPRLDLFEVADLGSRLRDNISRAVKAPDQVVRELIVALLAEGHVLIEDAPGVGKTALARALARSLEAEYARVQCTSDLLPADLVGTNVFNQRTSTFEFHPGPVFANVVLVDEINRASPKTQSGLLECMQERHVTVDNNTHELARPFLVVATQNPVEYEGTYPLPEAQLDQLHGPGLAWLPDAGTSPRCWPSTPTPRPRVEEQAGRRRGAACAARRRPSPESRDGTAAPLRGRGSATPPAAMSGSSSAPARGPG